MNARLVATCWLLLCLGCTASHAAEITRVPLVINEPFADRAVPWPITTGVPFPRGALKKAENCWLVDDRGKPQPLQTKVAATWDTAGSSIRWLTIDFIAEPGRTYQLEFLDRYERRSEASYWKVEKDQGYLSVNPNGVPIALFTTAKPATIRDLSNAVGSPVEGEHFLIDQDGRTYSSGPDHPERKLEVKTNGPVRLCVQTSGFYVGPAGERIAAYRTNYHFFRDIPGIKVVDELRFITSTKGKRFRDIGFRLHHRGNARQVIVDQSGDPGNQPLLYDWQPETKSLSSFQKTYRHYGNPECVGEVAVATRDGEKQLAASNHVGEWIQVADDRAAVTGSLRWFWQQFPKEWEVNKDYLTLHYWSPKAGELDFGKAGIEKFFGPAGEKYLRAGRDKHNRNPLDHAFYHADLGAIERGDADGLGINKHHEFWLFFNSREDAKVGQDYARHAAVQPLCLATGEWNRSTDVFGPLAARPNDSKYEAAVDKIFDLSQQVQDEFGDYGWWLFGAGPHYSYHLDEQTGKHYADSRRFEFHTYGKETQLWWNYLRSGERKFYDWAIPSENHWCDIAVAHEPTKIHCDWLGGTEQKNRTLHWRPGEWSIDNPTHYIRTHDRAEAWLRGGAQFWASYHRTLETTTLAYYLTGDERYQDVIRYWKDYWSDLAGKTNRSPGIKPWHQEQAWYQTFKDDPREMTWAEMIRDYAPFSSGSRHQQTLFFNLATLYEHTWDPKLKQVLDEYSAAFLDVKHPIGVWRSQDNSLPAHAEAPAMAHFWLPALWKYARATNDPRMKEIFAKYFEAAYAADPFREFEDVGVYSNAYVGYAYYFTRDPRWLTLAKHELDQLLPYALPFNNPQEINQRLYNPYAPAKTFTAVPRLLWAVQEGERLGQKPDPAPLRMQRTLTALYKSPGKELKATLWGFEPTLKIIAPTGEPYLDAKVSGKKYASEIQPFDRLLPNYECYLQELTIPASAPAGHYLLVPQLELAVLESNSPVLWNAARPIALKTGEVVYWQLPSGTMPELAAVSGQLTANPSSPKLALHPNSGHVIIGFGESRARLNWLKVNRPIAECWMAPGQIMPADILDGVSYSDRSLTDEKLLAKLLPPSPAADERMFVPGRFGHAAQVNAVSQLHIPDHVTKGDTKQRLFDETQGTIEFWIRRKYDDRLNATRPLPLLTNGWFSVLHQPTMPLGEWAHIAVVWAPYKDRGTIQYVYVDGRDAANYRSINWDGYSAPRPTAGPKNAKWLEEFIVRANVDSGFEIDELRVSKVARYAQPDVTYGPQQTFNPVRFTPREKPFEPDEHTTLLLHFDEALSAAVPEGLSAEFVRAAKK